MNDREFRRRAHAAFAALMAEPQDDPDLTLSRIWSEIAALNDAGPDDLRVATVDVPGVGDVRMVEIGKVRFVCPACGPGVSIAEDFTCSTCGADVFREDAPWFVRLVVEARGPILGRVKRPCGCWEDVRAFNRCDAHVMPGEATGGFSGVRIARADPPPRRAQPSHLSAEVTQPCNRCKYLIPHELRSSSPSDESPCARCVLGEG